MAASPGTPQGDAPFPEELSSTRDSTRAATLTSSSSPPGSGFPYRRKRETRRCARLKLVSGPAMDCLPSRCRQTSLPKSSGKQ